MTTEFRLTPHEDFVRGVSLHGSTLRFAASGAQLIEAGIMSVAAAIAVVSAALMATGSGTTVNGLRIDHPWPVVAAALVIACVLIVRAVALCRSGVVATPRGLALREGWRWRTLGWDQVADVQTVQTATERWTAFFGGDGLELRTPPVGAFSLGVVVTADGTAVALPSCSAAARDEGLSMGGPTPSELKVAALRRYREETVGEWPGSVRPVQFSELGGAPHPARALLWVVAGPVALWVVANLASDQSVPFLNLVFWWVVALALLGWSRRAQLRAAFRAGAARGS